MNKEIEQAVREVIEQGNAIIRQAQIKTEQIKQLENEQDTDHRR
jgi:hypothetical protein